MTAKRFTVLKKIENSDIEADVIDTYIEKLVKDGKSVGWVTVGILDKGNPITYKDCVDLLNENEQLKQLLDYADDLIQSHLSEHYIRQWRNFKTGHKEYNDFWKEKLKKHNELKDG